MRPDDARPVLLRRSGPVLPFADPARAAGNLVAVGGDLRQERLLQAYSQGIFPWFGEGDPILWWSPDPRGVLFPERIHVSRSLRKAGRSAVWRFSVDEAFPAVLDACAAPRAGQGGTWITADMRGAYLGLFHAGHAHSLEVWSGDMLAGGLYGVSLGGLFFGESMFSRMPDASKLALVLLARHLQHWGYGLIDTQFLTPHLESMGAEELPREEFLARLRDLRAAPLAHRWQLTLPLSQVF